MLYMLNMKYLNIFLKYWLPLFMWVILIFLLSSIPDLKSGLPNVWDLILRKIAHFIEFAILAILALRLGLRNEAPKNRKYVYLAAILFGIIYAIFDEYHQSFVSGREARLLDVAVDSLGVFFGTILWRNK